MFRICIPFPVVFMNLQMSNIGSVNYARFPKSGHISAIQFPVPGLYMIFMEFDPLPKVLLHHLTRLPLALSVCSMAFKAEWS